jgi:hydroxymethylbilane synthase
MSTNKTLRLGTRGSDLAMVQARATARDLEALGYTVEICVKNTVGDIDKTSSFANIGPPGVFVREIEAALVEGELDLAVHCYKDLPSQSPDGLVIGAVPQREDPGEVLVTRAKKHHSDEPGLPLLPGALVGTSAARRRALIGALRPDVLCRELRGNVPTRLAKLAAGEYDAIVLAAAGIKRLQEGAERGENAAPPLDDFCLDHLCLEAFVPAPSQGALAIQVREDNAFAVEACAKLHDEDSALTVAAERELLRLIQAGCEAPFGAYCAVNADGDLDLWSVFETDGFVHRARAKGSDPLALAAAVHATLMGKSSV